MSRSSRAARFGAARLRHDLRASGVAEEIIAVLPADAGPRKSPGRARSGGAGSTRRRRRPRRLCAPGALPARQRGFAMDVIRKVLKEQE
jgi:SOS response regulatory protein OraA/RecX